MAASSPAAPPAAQPPGWPEPKNPPSLPLRTPSPAQSRLRRAKSNAARASALVLFPASGSVDRRRHQLRAGISSTELIIALLTGAEEKVNEMGGRYEHAFSVAAEVFAYAAEEVQTLQPPDQGVIMGAVVFEIVATVVPLSKIKHADKAKAIDDLAAGRVAQTGPGAVVFSRTMEFANAARTTKMCFVAGTLVLTAQGLLPIERVESGMEVRARCEATMEEGWKPVVQTFKTHPGELFTLGIDTDGDGATDEEITGTGEHPFWVEHSLGAEGAAFA